MIIISMILGISYSHRQYSLQLFMTI